MNNATICPVTKSRCCLLPNRKLWCGSYKQASPELGTWSATSCASWHLSLSQQVIPPPNQQLINKQTDEPRSKVDQLRNLIDNHSLLVLDRYFSPDKNPNIYQSQISTSCLQNHFLQPQNLPDPPGLVGELFTLARQDLWPTTLELLGALAAEPVAHHSSDSVGWAANPAVQNVCVIWSTNQPVPVQTAQTQISIVHPYNTISANIHLWESANNSTNYK